MSRLLMCALLVVILTGLLTAAPPDAGTAPLLDPLWTLPTIREDQTRRWVLLDAVKAQQERGRPVLHAAQPLVVGERIVFRNQRGLHAVERSTGKTVWEAESPWSLDVMNAESPKAPIVSRWVAAHLGSVRSTFLHDNAVLGRLASDGQLVFAVDDLAVPPFAGAFTFSDEPYEPFFGQPVNDAAYHSRLQAYSLRTGKLTWEVGNRRRGEPLSDAFFLGSPLVHDGKLLVPIEKEGQLRLVCLAPSDGRLLWQLDLAAVRVRAHLDAVRRVQGVRLAAVRDMVVCNLGEAVVGVDLETRSVNWAYTALRSSPSSNPGTLPALFVPSRSEPRLEASDPILDSATGNVLFNAPDGDSVICVRLLDGRLVWRTPALRDDVFLAGVVGGRALVVGRRGVRALAVKDGQRQWFTDTGEPSGRGAAANGVYHLPVRADSRTGRPGVVSLAGENGEIVAWARAGSAEPPGNLVLAQRVVVSQALDRVTLFPQIREALAQADDRVLKSASAANRLARGELRLAAGEVAGAVEDLQAVLAEQPTAEQKTRAEAALLTAIPNLLERDFPAGEKHLAEYEKLVLATPPEEQHRRAADLFYLVAMGRLSQQQPEKAADLLLLHLTRTLDTEPSPSPEDPGLRVQRSLRATGKLRRMLEMASAPERTRINRAIANAWQAARDNSDTDALRRIARLLNGLLSNDLDYRRGLAEQFLRNKDFLDAERLLLSLVHQRENPSAAARAVETMVHLSLDQELPEEAAHYLRLLEKDYRDTALRDGDSGSAVARRLAADKRLRAYLDAPESARGSKYSVRQLPPGESAAPQWFLFEPQGDLPLWFRSHALAYDVANGNLKLLDASGKELWSERLSTNQFRNFAATVSAERLAPHLCRVRGHLVVLTLGTRIHAIDPLARKVLWERSLLGSMQERLGTPAGATVTADAVHGRPQLQFPDGTLQPLGQVAALTSDTVCVQTLDGLFGLDAITGRALWQRSDVEPGGDFFHDDEHLFHVRPGGVEPSRAFAIRDGSQTTAPDCSMQFSNRLGELGRGLLLAEPGRGLTLRLFDALIGKDVWQHGFPVGSRVVSCWDDAFAAAVDPQGRLTVLNRATGKAAANLNVDPKHLEGVRELRLLSDAERFYLVPEMVASPERIVGGAVMPNTAPGSGLLTVPAHGMLYAFRRDDSRLSWQTELPPQRLVLSQFKDLPVLLLTCRLQTLHGSASSRRVEAATPLLAIDRRTGKYLFDRDLGWTSQPIHRVTLDLKTGTIELTGNSGRVRMMKE